MDMFVNSEDFFGRSKIEGMFKGDEIDWLVYGLLGNKPILIKYIEPTIYTEEENGVTSLMIKIENKLSKLNKESGKMKLNDIIELAKLLDSPACESSTRRSANMAGSTMPLTMPAWAETHRCCTNMMTTIGNRSSTLT